MPTGGHIVLFFWNKPHSTLFLSQRECSEITFNVSYAAAEWFEETVRNFAYRFNGFTTTDNNKATYEPQQFRQ